MSNVIEVHHLQKSYGQVLAVDGISFAVQKGEIFGIVGPNGAGKTTTIETIMGLRQADGGQISVLGLDPQKDAQALANRIGIQLQHSALPDRMKVWEALDLYASFYERTIAWEPLLEQWGLGDKRNAPFATLSGGQKQRLFICLALLNDPEIVFLDELTTGLDPQSRRATWELVTAIRDQGKTVILISHYMDEVEKLADRVAIIDHGKLIALNTPATLIQEFHGEARVHFTAENGFEPHQLSAVDGITSISQDRHHITVRGHGPLLVRVAVALHQHHFAPADLQVEYASLEDVFLTLTGRRIRN